MEGYVSADRPEPRLTVNILDCRGTVVPAEAVIDTGFTGFMTLPDADINTLQLEQNRNSDVAIAARENGLVTITGAAET